MVKKYNINQQTGDIGEAAAELRFKELGFIFRPFNSTDTGIDGNAEVVVNEMPTGKRLNVQVKATRSGLYDAETDDSFIYRLSSDDLEYWRQHIEPVIIVLYRLEDRSFYWKDVLVGKDLKGRKLVFDKKTDILNEAATDSLIALAYEAGDAGPYMDAVELSETAIVNMLPIILPEEIYVSGSTINRLRTGSEMLSDSGQYRSDWILSNTSKSIWSFRDPRNTSIRMLVEEDQVECIETSEIAFSDDLDVQNDFAFLLRRCVQDQYHRILSSHREDRDVLYFSAPAEYESREYRYQSFENKTKAEVVMVNPGGPKKRSFVRHHAINTRFYLFGHEWCMVFDPTYVFTKNGYTPLPRYEDLLSGKKRLETNASLRGIAKMWEQLFTDGNRTEKGLFETEALPIIKFQALPEVELERTVPEKVWNERRRLAKLKGKAVSSPLFDELGDDEE